jgi:hypothetical protein
MAQLGVQVNYVYKRGNDYTLWVDTAGTYTQVPYVDSVGVDATNQTVMVYRLTSPAADRVFLQTTDTSRFPGNQMYMRYNGVTMSLTKRMSQNWQGVISLVLSKAEGRLASSARFTPITSQVSTATATNPFGRDVAGPNDFVNTDGLLIGDRPVVAKAQLTYKFPWDVLVAANMQHQTGRLYPRQVRVSMLGNLGFPAAPTINMEANTGERRVKDMDLVDVRAQKDFRFQGARSVGVFVDVLNLFNNAQTENVASLLGTATTFGQGIRFVPPRRAMIGAKFRW